MLHRHIKVFAILALAIGLATGLAVIGRERATLESRATSVPAEDLTTNLGPTLSPTLQFETMDSPDGTMRLTVERLRESKDSIYTVTTSTAEEDEKTLIFSTNLPNNTTLSIPYNTWSPDNKYFFLKKTGSLGDEHYVFSSSEDTIKDDLSYFNIQQLFTQKHPDFTITDVTGWADPILIVVNTVEQNGGEKVSFWFNVKNSSFTRLGTYFF